MEYRPIEVKLICAKDLKDVNVFSTMNVYIIGSVSGDPRNMQRTPVHKDGGTNPGWNYDMRFAVDESAARLNRLGLVFQIMSERTLGDKEIGRVYVPLKELFEAGNVRTGDASVEDRHSRYQVQTPSGKFKGVLEFSFKFGERFIQRVDWTLDEPVKNYPARTSNASEENGNPGCSANECGYGYVHVQSVVAGNPQVGYGYGFGSSQPPSKLDTSSSGYGFGSSQPPSKLDTSSSGYGFGSSQPPSKLDTSSRLCTCGATTSNAAQLG